MGIQENGNNDSSVQNDNSIQNEASSILGEIGVLIGIAWSDATEDGLLPEEGAMVGEEGENPEDTGLGIEGEVVAEVDPFEQIRSDMALLKSAIAGLPSQDVINKLQSQVAMLPSKDEIVKDVLGQIQIPTCSCQQSIGADNPDLGLGDPRRDGNVE